MNEKLQQDIMEKHDETLVLGKLTILSIIERREWEKSIKTVLKCYLNDWCDGSTARIVNLVQ